MYMLRRSTSTVQVCLESTGHILNSTGSGGGSSIISSGSHRGSRSRISTCSTYSHNGCSKSSSNL